MSTMRSLLIFLLHNQPRGELTWRTLKKLYRDKALEVGYTECAAISALLLKRIKVSPKSFALARPHYKSKNYLHVFPPAFSLVN